MHMDQMMRHDVAAMHIIPQVRGGAWVTFPYNNYKLQKRDLGLSLVFWSDGDTMRSPEPFIHSFPNAINTAHGRVGDQLQNQMQSFSKAHAVCSVRKLVICVQLSCYSESKYRKHSSYQQPCRIST